MTIARAQDEIIEEMSRLEDWMDKYEYLVQLGRGMDTGEEDIKTDEYALTGCQSRVWIKGEMADGRLLLTADSDAMITRGIIALVLRVLNNQPPPDILDADLYFLDETGLRDHLSPTRSNGLNAMVSKIREYAEKYSKSE